MLYEADLLRIADALLLLGPLECLLVAVQLEGRESRPKFIIPVGIPTKSFSRYYLFRDLLIVMILGFSKREIAWMMKIHEISPREIFGAKHDFMETLPLIAGHSATAHGRHASSRHWRYPT